MIRLSELGTAYEEKHMGVGVTKFSSDPLSIDSEYTFSQIGIFNENRPVFLIDIDGLAESMS